MIPMDRKSPVDPHIGQRLKEYRQHRGMTVRELADAAHVTPGQISRYEHGRDRISHERVTEFARILRIKSNDLYQQPGSRLRRNHVRWRLTNFMAAVIAEAVALMSSRRKAVADDETTMVAAVAVAVAAVASAAAASDAGAGEKSSLTTSADDTAVDISGSLSGAALKFNPIWHRMAETVTDKEGIIVVEGKLEISDAVSETIFRADAKTTLQLDASDAANALLIRDGANTDTINLPGHRTINAAESQGRGGKVAYDPPMSAAGEQASAQSTSAENGFIVSNPFPFAETASGNEDHSALQFKPGMDHHAVTDPEINDITKEHPEHPAHPHSDDFKFADNDDHPDKASHDHSKINDIAKEHPEHPAHPHSDDFKFADNDAHPGKASHDHSKINDITKEHPEHPAHPHSDNFKFVDNDAHPGKASHDHSKINDIAKEHPEHPAHPHSDNFKFADDDGSAHPGHATGKDKDISVQPSADPKIGDIAKEHPEHPAHPHSDQLASFKFADEGSADSGRLAHPHFDNAKVPGTVMSGAASDQFVFEKGHDKVADVKPDMIETDHAVADIQHLLHTAHDANAVGALNPNHTTAPQDMTKVQLPHYHGDFHFA
jgi:DNA-binding XRE family transcriptional regulator